MGVVVKLSDDLVAEAKIAAEAEHRSVSMQIEYWARVGKAALDNLDLPLKMILDTMVSIEEATAARVAGYKFG